mmetsp:Transcript_48534/g.123100  ORF Transcript_48534/g.123100 Transcript_48534/m.123100 type:complete len:172 (+) Transcript_48534:122-637(+)
MSSASLGLVGRKRRPCGDEDAAELATAASPWEEVRLPASTMLFCSEAARSAGCEDDGDRDWPEEFSLSHAVASASCVEASRVLQWKPTSQLHLVRPAAQPAREACPLEPDEARRSALREAAARGADGALLAGGLVVALCEPSECLVLIDDDKKEGLSQQLLTDMFTRMNLK